MTENKGDIWEKCSLVDVFLLQSALSLDYSLDKIIYVFFNFQSLQRLYS